MLCLHLFIFPIERQYMTYNVLHNVPFAEVALDEQRFFTSNTKSYLYKELSSLRIKFVGGNQLKVVFILRLLIKELRKCRNELRRVL